MKGNEFLQVVFIIIFLAITFPGLRPFVVALIILLLLVLLFSPSEQGKAIPNSSQQELQKRTVANEINSNSGSAVTVTARPSTAPITQPTQLDLPLESNNLDSSIAAVPKSTVKDKNESKVKREMGNKIEFGADFIHILAEINTRSGKNFNPLIHAARGIFLIEWDLSVLEVDEATKLFFERLNEEKLDNLLSCTRKIQAYIGDKQESKERLLIQFSSMAFLDKEVTEEARDFINEFADVLDFRRSEANALYTKAFNLAISLQVFAEACRV